MQKKDRNRIAILNVLRKARTPLTSAQLAEILSGSGLPISERTVRLYCKELGQEELAESRGKRGRVITEKGLEEIRAAQAFERVGYLSAKIDQLTYAMNFDLPTSTGAVVVNTSLVQAKHLWACIDRVCQVFSRGHAMGNRVALLAPGEAVGEVQVPADKVGLCTVCSITLNGVLLKHGVPTTSKFGGLLEVSNGQPTRFVEMIHYDGTSIDPLEIFIRGGMTNYTGAVRDGQGLIGASYREIPADARDLVVHLAHRLSNIGLGGFVQIGSPGQSVLGLPVSEGRIGSVVIGGLNPIAILVEAGYRVEAKALTGLMEYNRMFPYEELPDALKRYL